jgi:hypothetical protein
MSSSAAMRMCFVASVLVLLPLASSAQQLPTAIPQTKWASGQDIAPYFDGWIRNPDGTFDLVFGYFNRNWQEELAIPVGPDNLIEPGAPDRGQPTFFLPRRQGWVFRVRVPGDFGKQVLTWTIRANGKTEKAYGELLPVEEISERIIQTRGGLNPGEGDPNKPPTVAIAPVSGASVAQPVMVTADVTDDGLPKPRAAIVRTQAADATRIQQQTNSSATAQRRGLNVTWMQLRGPAKAVLESPMFADGKASVSARFSQPGTYVLRATANDGALATKADVTIAVGGGASSTASTASKGSPEGQPLIDNDRVSVWSVTSTAPKVSGDSVWISLDRLGEAAYRPATTSGRGVLIGLKDKRVTPLENKTGHPNAFPRPGVKKVLENDRVIVWDYTWTPGVPTPMHFHDKDVVVTYVADGALKSTTPDGQSTVNEFSAGTIRFNLRDRTHTELLTTGKARAIITELK